ncbi:hypothetical protein HanRHA438_Chr17g0835341 [Helianthus annuus]|nr:hypothetical protein HanRHA438_Chr17g0835341 [Helianthus annuus]
MMDELHRQDSLLDIAKVRESRLLAKKQKAEDDLKRVTLNLAKERVIWAQDCQEKERMISHALKTQKELERKANVLTSQVQRLRIDREFIAGAGTSYRLDGGNGRYPSTV